jgi:PBP1b-binding outer membrane lipoprotein LpoB
MKKVAVCLLAGFFFSCSGGDTTTKTNEQSNPSVPIENVNGNIPDTVNSVSIEKPQTDSVTVKDSTRK